MANRIGVIIPHRGDRPRFLNHLKHMLSVQTLQPDIVEFVDFPPASSQKDITKRYRDGYDRMRNKGLDVIFFMEVDDWYAPNYLETALNAWISHGKPDLFGQRSTIYYHIKEFGYFTMYHEQRSSAMSTLIRPDLTFDWPPDWEPYTDVWLFNKLKYSLFQPEKPISMGIKHGDGLCGGLSHAGDLSRYHSGSGRTDHGKAFLKSTVDPVSFEFYSRYFSGGAAI